MKQIYIKMESGTKTATSWEKAVEARVQDTSWFLQEDG